MTRIYTHQLNYLPPNGPYISLHSHLLFLSLLCSWERVYAAAVCAPDGFTYPSHEQYLLLALFAD